MLKPAVVDLSHYNVIPQSLVPAKDAGILGVVHKATEGLGSLDAKCAARFELAKEAGLLWGLYHFLRPGSAAAQVDSFLSKSGAVLTEHTMIACDYEDNSVDLGQAIEFLDQIVEKLGRSPVIYSGNTLKEKIGTGNPHLAPYRLWLAQYTTGTPSLPAGYQHYWLWQYTDHGSVPGITGPVDLNAYGGTSADLTAEWSGLKTPAPPAPTAIVPVTLTLDAPIGVPLEVIVRGQRVYPT